MKNFIFIIYLFGSSPDRVELIKITNLVAWGQQRFSVQH